ncbi:hypothetical protein [Dactylosporangium sp. NPDC049140]|uniref:hypothetical protein n=1 Tax=Dactylosporangium sp. NPDC049140 TaxID=3155647 RepID=UPI0033E4E81F
MGLPVAKRFDAMGMVLFEVGNETPGLGVGVSDTPRAGRAEDLVRAPDARGSAAEMAASGITPAPEPFCSGLWSLRVQFAPT